jgi:GT2 family glycosyltransferase
VSPASSIISIIIVTYNNEHDIKNCLNSIYNQNDVQPEVFLIDNASKDITVQIVQKEFPQVRLLLNKRNLGYAHANNQGINLSQGKYLLLLNPDARLKPDALFKMMNFMDANLQYSALAPKLLNPDESIQASLREFPSYQILFWEITGLSRLFPHHRYFGRWRMGYFDYNKIAEIDQPLASCLLIRKQVFEKIGQFDEIFPIFFNDVDFSKRMKKAGFKTVYLPDAEVYHYRGASTSQVRVKMIWEWHFSLFRYFKKHHTGKGFFLISIPLGLIIIFGACLRILIFRIKNLFNPKTNQ